MRCCALRWFLFSLIRCACSLSSVGRGKQRSDLWTVSVGRFLIVLYRILQFATHQPPLTSANPTAAFLCLDTAECSWYIALGWSIIGSTESYISIPVNDDCNTLPLKK